LIGTGEDGAPEVDRDDWRCALEVMTICTCGELGVRCDRRELPHGVMLTCPICDVWTFFFWRREVTTCHDASNRARRAASALTGQQEVRICQGQSALPGIDARDASSAAAHQQTHAFPDSHVSQYNLPSVQASSQVRKYGGTNKRARGPKLPGSFSFHSSRLPLADSHFLLTGQEPES
jgi:hypothetical protein